MSAGERKKVVRHPVISSKRKAQQHVVETAKAVLDERCVTREEREAWRRAMGNEYVYNPRGITLAQLANNPRLGNVAFSTVVEWSRKDNWVALRKAFAERVRRMVERSIANDHVKAQIEELRYLIKLHGEMQAKLEQALNEMPLKSFEAGVTSFLKLDERIDERRQQLQAVLVDRNPPEEIGEGTEAAKPVQIAPRLTEAENVAAVKAILRERWAGPDEDEADEVDEVEGEPVIVVQPARKKRPPPRRDDGGEPTKSGP